MSWLDYLKSFGSTGRQKLREKAVAANPTAGMRSQVQFYGSEVLVNQLPLFTIRIGRLMLRSDPLVAFALDIRNAALMVADFEYTAKKEHVRAWVESQWTTLWNKHRNKLLSAKRWGFAPLQITLKEQSGLVVIDDVKDFAPEDCRALECSGKVSGFRVKDRRVMQPHALWLTFNAEYGSPYGTGCFRRMYPPWYEKWTDHGAKKLLQLRMLKDAYIGDIFWYAHNQLVEIPRSDGTTQRIPWRDVVREIGENRLSGGAISLPSIFDDRGNKLVDYTPPQDVPGGTHIFDWRKDCDEDILRGAGVPLETIKAGETGSGYSGRSIPLMVLLSLCTGELTEIVEAVTANLRVLAWLNWGGDEEFEIKPKSLVESFAADAGGSPMGGSAMGGQPGQRPPQPGQPSQPGLKMGWVGNDGQVTQFDEGSLFGQSADVNDIAAIGASTARSRIRGAASRIRALKKNDLPLIDLAAAIEQEIIALRRGLSSDLSASMLGGQVTGMANAWSAMPAEFFEPPPSPVAAPPAPPQEPPSIAEMLGPDEPTPAVSFPVVDEALELLAEAPAVARPDFRATAEAVKQGAFAITGDLTDAAVADVRDILAENLRTGPDRETFVDTVIERLGEDGPLSDAHVENIFRTNVAAAMSDGTEKALSHPMVADAFPYRAYWATTDQRVRKNHIALERLGLDGTNIYSATDPSWQKFRPPWDFQCRCAWNPVSVEQAARRGVKEAQEWLERAKAMAEARGGSEYQYFTRTAPAEPQWVPPPPFAPSPVFERRASQFDECLQFSTDAQGDEHSETTGRYVPKGTSGPPAHQTAVSEFVDKAIAHSLPSSLRIDFRPVSDSEAIIIKAATGVDVAGFVHSMDGSAVGHILHSHGKEPRSGQEPVTAEDIKKAAWVIDNFDQVDLDPNSPHDSPAIRFRKRVNGTIYVVEAKRTGKRQKGAKRLAIISMYKHKAGSSGPHPTPEAT